MYQNTRERGSASDADRRIATSASRYPSGV